jgi:hypothetical protein
MHITPQMFTQMMTFMIINVVMIFAIVFIPVYAGIKDFLHYVKIRADKAHSARQYEQNLTDYCNHHQVY